MAWTSSEMGDLGQLGQDLGSFEFLIIQGLMGTIKFPPLWQILLQYIPNQSQIASKIQNLLIYKLNLG